RGEGLVLPCVGNAGDRSETALDRRCQPRGVPVLEEFCCREPVVDWIDRAGADQWTDLAAVADPPVGLAGHDDDGPATRHPHNRHSGCPIPIPLANQGSNEDLMRGAGPSWSGWRWQ